MNICAICTRDFTPEKKKQIVCGIECAVIAGKAMTSAKKQKEIKRQDKIKRSTAAQLSFNTSNVWASCATCNSVLSGNLTEYRIELINRIGEKRVQALENNNQLANYSREYLMRLRSVFSKKRKHLMALREKIAT